MVDVWAAEQFFPWKSGQYFHEPPCIWQTFSAVRILREWIFWEPSSTHSVLRCRVLEGWRGSPGVLTPR